MIPSHSIPFACRPLSAPARACLAGALLLCVGGTLAGCNDAERPLQVSHLVPAERLYVERVVAVERAKAVALVAREAGEALLDSLSAAWGDSAAFVTARGLPADPARTKNLADLLLRVVSAEQDSLLLVPGRNRLQQPLPPPAVAATPPTGTF